MEKNVWLSGVKVGIKTEGKWVWLSTGDIKTVAMKTFRLTCININTPVVLVHLSAARCYPWRKLKKEYRRSLNYFLSFQANQ